MGVGDGQSCSSLHSKGSCGPVCRSEQADSIPLAVDWPTGLGAGPLPPPLFPVMCTRL